MDPVTAQITFGVILSLMVLAWAISLRKASLLGRQALATGEDPFAPLTFEPTSESTIESGDGVRNSQTVRGRTEDVSLAIVDQFTRTAVPGNYATIFEVTEATSDKVVVRKTGPLMCNQPTGMYFSEAEFDLRQLGDDVVEVSYELGFERFRKRVRTICLGLIVGVTLPVMIIAGFVIWFLVVSSENPGVRWQVFQTLQLTHLIWPPFLLIWMYGSGQTHSNTYVSNMLRALRPADFSVREVSR